MIETSNDDHRSAASSYDILEECAICFMIFPLNMGINDRITHVIEHYQIVDKVV